MAVRVPLHFSSGDLKEMSSAMVDELVDQIVYQYSTDPGVVLSVVSSGGSLASINDTRLQAGAMSTHASSFPSEATTAEPSVITVTYNKIDSTNASNSKVTDTGKTWPIYYTATGDVQAMTLTDVKDTFFKPAINLLTASSTTTQQGGTYTIHTSTSLSGATLVSATPIYKDTRADVAAYTASAIPESQDQPATITNYYLFQIDGNNTSYTLPCFLTAGDDVQEFLGGNFQSLVKEWIKEVSVSESGYRISYNIGTTGSGNTRGSGIADTILTGSGNYQTFQAGADDYRAQEFPDGSTSTSNTYYLRINKS